MYVYLWLICVVVRQKPTQHCKAIILQLKISLKSALHIYMYIYSHGLLDQLCSYPSSQGEWPCWFTPTFFQGEQHHLSYFKAHLTFQLRECLFLLGVFLCGLLVLFSDLPLSFLSMKTAFFWINHWPTYFYLKAGEGHCCIKQHKVPDNFLVIFLLCLIFLSKKGGAICEPAK